MRGPGGGGRHCGNRRREEASRRAQVDRCLGASHSFFLVLPLLTDVSPSSAQTESFNLLGRIPPDLCFCEDGMVWR